MPTPAPELRRAGLADVPAVHAIQLACGADLEARFGRGHWGWTPPLDWRRNDADAGLLWAAWLAGTPVATFTLSTEPIRFYDLSLFREPARPAAYLTSMAVQPARQGAGLGRWCLAQAEALARRWGCAALRFDAYDHPAGAGGFYARCDCRPVARIVYRKVPLILFEKVLAPQPEKVR